MARDRIDELVEQWGQERPDLDVSSIQVVGRIMHLGHQFEIEANQHLKSFGLNYTDFDVLATLRRAGKPHALSPTQLRQSVVISSGAMTVCLDRLEKRKLIRRKPSKQDRRAVNIQLTKSGFELVDAAIEARIQSADANVSALSTAQKEQLRTLLKALF